MKKTLLILILVTSSLLSHAQDFKVGTFTADEITMEKYAKDTSAHALYLTDHGRLEINTTNDDRFKYILRRHVRIKIFDSRAFDKATIQIPLYNDGEEYEDVQDIDGVTTFTNDNGGVQQAALDKSQIFKVKEDKHWTNIKFTMPNVHNGCIIDYTYTIYSVYWERLPIWYFQDDIPKMSSEYDLHLPAYWTYNASLRGGLKLSKNVAEVEHGCFTFNGNAVDCSHIDLGMTDIPAFKEEADMTSYKNFISAAYFELAQFINPYTGAKQNFSRQWSDIDYQLKHLSSFGGQLRRKELMKEHIAPAITGITDSLSKAMAIYAYIQKSIKYNGQYDIFTDDGIRKALDNHSGTVAEVNIALITALESAGFDAEAVLLSTREHGLINKLYPTIQEFNYIIAKVNIGGKSYLLDATDPLLSFGMLPLRCINDQGRVMCLDKPSYWIDLANAGQKGVNTYNYDLTLQPDGKIKGTMVHYASGYAAYTERVAIKKFNSVDEYVESLDERSPRFRILKSNIDGVDSLNNPIAETYEIEIKEFDNVNHDRLMFNPFIMDYISVNPYKLTERSYPVDLGMPTANRYTLTLHLPDNYTVDTPPQNIGVALPNNGGMFQTAYQADGNSFTFSHVIQLNKSVYSSEEYPYLKELYNTIILTQKAEMVLKRKL
jgi:hypothetical protein